MPLSQKIKRNMSIDPRDPEFDEDLVATPQELEDLQEYEAEQKQEALDNMPWDDRGEP